MISKRYTHKQSKYFTIMLIPDSSAKIRRIRIPYWGLSFVVVPLLFCILTVTINQTRLTYENHLLQLKFAHQEEEIVELWDKSDAIQLMKQDIIDIFQMLPTTNLPIPIDDPELILEDNPVGGAYPMTSNQAMIALSELETLFAKELNDMQTLSSLSAKLLPFIKELPTGWPVNERIITEEFGYRVNPFNSRATEYHTGIDIATAYYSDVCATADGVVTFAGYSDVGYGNLVIIEHAYGYSTYYAHNISLRVSVGDKVERGQIIALSGSSGRSSGPHCHYEVRLNGNPLNPIDYLN